MRIKAVRIVIVCLFLLIIAELMYVQVIRGSFYFHLSKNNRIRVIPLEGLRGKIKDRNGEIIADNELSYDVAVIPQDVIQREELFKFLSQILRKDQHKIANNYFQRKFAPFAPVVIAEGVSREQAIVIEENRYRFPSLFIEENSRRVYSLGESAAHVLGYVGKMNRAQLERTKEYGYSPDTLIGKTGIEEYYDQYLKGKEGGKQIEVNSRGQQVRLLGLKESTEGKDVSLTIDAELQRFIYGLLAGRPGAITVVDIDSGEVLGLTSSPSFDPETKSVESQEAPYLNRAIAGRFPPGSVFKIPVALAGLSTHKINSYSTFTCPGFYELGGIRFGCTHTHGPQNLMQAVAHSCNVYFYNLGRIVGPDTMHHYAALFGFGSKTGIDLPYEEAGNVPSRMGKFLKTKIKWFGGDTLNYSIGQGDVLATPIQLTQMMAAIANDGKYIEPHFIKAIDIHEVAGFAPKMMPVAKENLTLIQKAMRATVTDETGTAHSLDSLNFYVSGKTGTAQSSHQKEHHAWFAGIAKTEKRRIAFCVFLEHGGSSHNAVQLTNELLQRMKEMGLI